MDIRELVAEFTERLHEAVDQISVARAREAVMHALGEKRGRLPKGMAAILGRKPRRKAPRQLCPVPGCRNPAAPVFGMVCAEHKDVPKAKIARYREARRAAKLTAKDGPGRVVRGRAKRSSAPASKRDGVGARATKRTVRAAKPAGASKTTGSARRGPRSKSAGRTKPPKVDEAADAAKTTKAAKLDASPSLPRPPGGPPSEMAGAAP